MAQLSSKAWSRLAFSSRTRSSARLRSCSASFRSLLPHCFSASFASFTAAEHSRCEAASACRCAAAFKRVSSSTFASAAAATASASSRKRWAASSSSALLASASAARRRSSSRCLRSSSTSLRKTSSRFEDASSLTFLLSTRWPLGASSSTSDVACSASSACSSASSSSSSSCASCVSGAAGSSKAASSSSSETSRLHFMSPSASISWSLTRDSKEATSEGEGERRSERADAVVSVSLPESALLGRHCGSFAKAKGEATEGFRRGCVEADRPCEMILGMSTPNSSVPFATRERAATRAARWGLTRSAGSEEQDREVWWPPPFLKRWYSSFFTTRCLRREAARCILAEATSKWRVH
mmetsp:Transcript_63862/g.208216  ORF Transcript_63862/g.208216 Transcript_63862/m.208216 type:complete len:355 (+) Transcript_63862:511-1575(+)